MNETGELGFRIRTELPRPDAALVEGFRGVASSNAADAMGRFHFMDPGIASRSGLPLCGTAVTVRCRPGDNLMVHHALEVASPGDVVVVTTNGNTASAVFGEIMCHMAVAAGLGGLVVDGAIRDVDEIATLSFPVFSRSVSAGACDKDGPGEINFGIACGNTVVMPGDIVIGDADGVAVVPWQEAEEVLERITALRARERARIEAIREGAVFKPEVAQTLKSKGVIQ